MRGSITKRGDSWLIRFDVGYETDPKTGKQKRKQRVSHLGGQGRRPM